MAEAWTRVDRCDRRSCIAVELGLLFLQTCSPTRRPSKWREIWGEPNSAPNALAELARTGSPFRRQTGSQPACHLRLKGKGREGGAIYNRASAGKLGRTCRCNNALIAKTAQSTPPQVGGCPPRGQVHIPLQALRCTKRLAFSNGRDRAFEMVTRRRRRRPRQGQRGSLSFSSRVFWVEYECNGMAHR